MFEFLSRPARAGDQTRAIVLTVARAAFAAAQATVLWGVFSPPAEAVAVLASDKAEHILAFFGLMLLGAPALPGVRPGVLALALALEGAMIELLQATPLIHRDADVGDWVADMAGIGAAGAVLIAARVGLRIAAGGADRSG